MKANSRISILDVAAAAGVSKSTASRALLGPAGVSESVRSHVLAVANDLGYVKDYRAHALKSSTTQMIGVFVRSARLSFYGELISVIQQEIESAGYRLSVATASPEEGRRPSALNSLMGLRPQGVIVASGRVPMAAVESAASETPFVMAGPSTRSSLVGSVSDDGTGAAELARLIVDAGHERVGLLSVPRTRSTTLGARSQRMRRALQNVGIAPITVPLAVDQDAADPQGLRALLGRVTAIMCPSDPTLITTWEILHRWGVRVPDDISLTGYDGIGQVASPVLGLTTWSQPVEAIAKAAAEQILSRLADPTLAPKHIRLTGSLVRGRTLGAPAHAGQSPTGFAVSSNLL